MSAPTLELFSRRLGENGPAVLLMHGVFGSGDNLANLGVELAHQYRVWLIDLRNHGRSPWAEGMSLPELAGDALALMQRENIDQAALVGHSLGGKVAMQMALVAPQRVSALVVADIAPVSYPPRHQAVLAGLTAVKPENLQRRSEAEAALAAHIEEAGVRQFLLKSLVKNDTGGYRWRFNLEELKQSYSQLSAAPEDGVYPGPTLFIKGENSNYLQPEHETVVRAMFPHFEFRMIAGTGHWLHAEKPALFNRLVKQFLERVVDSVPPNGGTPGR